VIEIHRGAGYGSSEHVYHSALQIEFPAHGLDVIAEYSMPIFYKAVPRASRRLDFLVGNITPAEIKAVGRPEDRHPAKALNYQEAFNSQMGCG
jgi:GxxExxY protein